MFPGKPDQVRQRIREELEQNPVWQVLWGPSWICPYCKEIAVGDLSRYSDPTLRIYRHFVEDCSQWEQGKEASLSELKEKVFLLNLKEQVKKYLQHPLWNLFNIENKWICPYCAQVTEIPKREPKALVKPVFQHMRSCYAFNKGKGQIKSEEYLRKILDNEKKTKQLEEIIKSKLQNDPLWKETTSLGNWICPLCKKEQPHIDLSNPINLTLNAPGQIAKHLVSVCRNFNPSSLMATVKKKKQTRVISIPLSEKNPSQKNTSLPGKLEKDRNEATSLVPLFTEPPPKQIPKDPSDSGPLLIPQVEFQLYQQKKPSSSKQNRAIEEELSSTLQIQISSRSLEMLPLLPPINEVEFQYIYEIHTSRSIDFLDFISLNKEKFGVFLVQINKPIPMPMVFELKEFLQTVGSSITSPKKLLEQIEDVYLNAFPITFSIQATYAIIDTQKDILTMARAGHLPMILFNLKRNRNFHVLKPKGYGLIKGSGKFKEEGGELKIKLQPGDMVVAYNSGLLELKGPDGKALGEQSFYQFIFKYGRHEAEYLRHKFLEKMKGNEEWSENVLLAAMKYKNEEE